MRQIALIDLDYFYAQCEQVRNPVLVGKPVVIVMPTIRGGGAIATCNYEARALRIRSGMSLSLAKKLSNFETIFINADKQYYKEISMKVFEIVDFFCEKVEQVSIDEAYLDLSNPEGFEKAEEICKKIKNKIKSDLSLTCSIGLAENMLIAKIASNEKKPDGFTKILPEKAIEFISKKEIKALPGLGPKSKKILEEYNIKTVNNLEKISREKLVELFGEIKGNQFYNFSRGIDERQVNPNREKQQISRLMTLKSDTSNFEEIKETVELMCEFVFNETNKLKKNFKTCSIIIITNKFETITKSKTISSLITLSEFKEIELNLLNEFLKESIQLVRRVGVRVSNFDSNFGTQKKLFDFK